MGQKYLIMLAVVGLVTSCSSMTPQDHSKAAFSEYSLGCVARGIPEHTQAHTDCVLSHYEAALNAQKRTETRMSEIFVDKNK